MPVSLSVSLSLSLPVCLICVYACLSGSVCMSAWERTSRHSSLRVANDGAAGGVRRTRVDLAHLQRWLSVHSPSILPLTLGSETPNSFPPPPSARGHITLILNHGVIPPSLFVLEYHNSLRTATSTRGGALSGGRAPLGRSRHTQTSCASKASLRRSGVYFTCGLTSPCSRRDFVKTPRSSCMHGVVSPESQRHTGDSGPQICTCAPRGLNDYRGTSLIGKCLTLGTYSRTMPRALRGS